MNEHPKAVCLLWQIDGHILAVSRKDDRTKFGLPGGKVDPGEDPETAIVREVEEETRAEGRPGVFVSGLAPIFTRVCPGDATYTSTTYYAAAKSAKLPPTPYVNTEGAVVDWVKPDVLLRGPFGDYNRALFQHLGIPFQG